MSINPFLYLENKVKLLEDYFIQFGIDSVVCGISGGVDSAIVGGILKQCSSLKRVIAVIAPISSKSATNQNIATERGLKQAKAFGMEIWKLDLTPVQFCYEGIMKCSPSIAEGDKRIWADGQILSIARTPLFYGVAAHLQAEGFKTIVSGTTNRSEGSYIGFYGKGSDGMNDIQPISDLWKSQVYQIANCLKVIPEIINEKPRGDVWDDRIDEEMIGATYVQIENYLEAKCLQKDSNVNFIYKEAIEKIHKTNIHKYLVGSPAVHFDILPRHVPGGWSTNNSFSHELGKKYV